MEIYPYFKSIVEQDSAPIVICDLNHEVIYMNMSSIRAYKRSIVGKSIFTCHNNDSRKLIEDSISWFEKSTENNIIHESYNSKENKDTYIVALRDDDNKLIGYYEKHEYRNVDQSSFYHFDNDEFDGIEETEHDDAKHQLFLRQKELLEKFLDSGAITQAQFDKSFYDMKEKMGFDK